MPRPQPPIARPAPLLAQLAIALRRNRDDVPQVLKAAGQRGERHVAMLISLALGRAYTLSGDGS